MRRVVVAKDYIDAIQCRDALQFDVATTLLIGRSEHWIVDSLQNDGEVELVVVRGGFFDYPRKMRKSINKLARREDVRLMTIEREKL